MVRYARYKKEYNKSEFSNTNKDNKDNKNVNKNVNKSENGFNKYTFKGARIDKYSTANEKDIICLQCRKSGHKASRCPERKSDEKRCCYRCGSTSHSLHECDESASVGLPFAKCFVCGVQGHLSGGCPQNPKGVYPNGGGCNVCGDVRHFVKDCPLKQQAQNSSVTPDYFSEEDEMKTAKKASKKVVQVMDPAQLRFEELGKLRALKRTFIKSSSEGNSEGGSIISGGISGGLIGTCQDMCPEYERLERLLHFDLTRPFETPPGGMAVKKYHRPAAGNEAPLPEDVRPPAVLLQTLDHLLSPQVLLRPDVPFLETQKFLRDRMRSLRQDLTLQNAKSFEAVHINQCVARFHIYCGVALRGAAKAEFDPFQNLEQLRKVLQTLYELYEDGHRQGRISRKPLVFEKEAEFRAYRILAHLDDPNEAYDDSAPAHIQAHPQFQNALGLANAFHTNNAFRFIAILNSESFLFRALASQWFPALQDKLNEVEEKAMEKMMQPVFLLPLQSNAFDGPLDVLIKSGCADERSLKLKSDFQVLVYHQLLQSLLPSSLLPLVQDCLERTRKSMEEQRAQRKLLELNELKEYNHRKQRLIQQATQEAMTNGLADVLRQVATEEIGRYHADRHSETKHVLATVIYDSCLDVCVPFYLKRIVYDSFAERLHGVRVKKRVFKRMRQRDHSQDDPDHSQYDTDHLQVRNIDSCKKVKMVDVNKNTIRSGDALLDMLLGRAEALPRELPLYKRYKTACLEIIIQKALTDEQKIVEIERQYPSFIFNTNSSFASAIHKVSSNSTTNGTVGVNDELRELKRMLAVEEEHTKVMESRLKELIKGD